METDMHYITFALYYVTWSYTNFSGDQYRKLNADVEYYRKLTREKRKHRSAISVLTKWNSYQYMDLVYGYYLVQKSFYKFVSSMKTSSSVDHPCSIKTRNPLSVNPTKWSNTLKQFVSCLNGFDNFVRLALKGLKSVKLIIYHQFLGPLLFFFYFDFMYHHVLEL